jgi:hypothetical protein
MVYYYVADAAGPRLVSTSPWEIRQWLCDGPSWPPGQYTVFGTESNPPGLGPLGTRRGVATKQPDGSVDLILDRPG